MTPAARLPRRPVIRSIGMGTGLPAYGGEEPGSVETLDLVVATIAGAVSSPFAAGDGLTVAEDLASDEGGVEAARPCCGGRLGVSIGLPQAATVRSTATTPTR